MARNTEAQKIAARVIEELKGFIKPGVSERDIIDFSERRMTELGSNSWWYHGIPGLVLVGDRSTLSVSGRDNIPSEQTKVGQTDIITADLAPTLDGVWGDYARTIIIEDGVVQRDPHKIKHPELRQGVLAEEELHRIFLQRVNTGMTYEEVYILMNDVIVDMGYVNLDFKGNLGHSVETDQADRIYLEKGVKETIADHGTPLTFEPHIKAVNGKYGFKCENIYDIDGERLVLV